MSITSDLLEPCSFASSIISCDLVFIHKSFTGLEVLSPNKIFEENDLIEFSESDLEMIGHMNLSVVTGAKLDYLNLILEDFNTSALGQKLISSLTLTDGYSREYWIFTTPNTRKEYYELSVHSN